MPECKVVPDVLAESSIGLLNIEVAVTHFVDPEKQEKLQRLGLATVELDLADLDRVDFGVLEDILLKPNDRVRWVYNPGDAHFYEEAQKDLALVIAEAEKKAAAEQAERDAELAERQAEWDAELAERDKKLRAFRLEQAKRDAEKREARRLELARAARFRAACEPDKLDKMLRFTDLETLPAFLPLNCRGGDSFGVRNPAIWQFALITGIIGASLKRGHYAINVDFAVTWLKYRFDIRPSFSNAEKIAAWDFLEGLAALKILRRSNKGYFEILVADTRALLNLVEYRHKLQYGADRHWAGLDAWLAWVPEELWPEQTVAERVAGQQVESIGYRGTATGWRRVMSTLLPTARTASVATVVSRYVTETVLPKALEYLVAAGFLHVKSVAAAPSAIRPPAQSTRLSMASRNGSRAEEASSPNIRS